MASNDETAAAPSSTTTSDATTAADPSLTTAPAAANSETQAAATATAAEVVTIVAPLEIGDTCQVLWRDGSTHLASKIIERKSIINDDKSATKSGKKKTAAVGGESSTSQEPPAKKSKVDDPQDIMNTTTATVNTTTSEAANYLYYIHYVGEDRRLDEWVPLDRFDLTTLVKVGHSFADHTIIITTIIMAAQRGKLDTKACMHCIDKAKRRTIYNTTEACQ
mmetsp:Transcript_30633/g.61478  ORF Transcript_30633/g.61478 Transcript_30633/m.61478 type:complete len:221 (-) Transcript_30633:463-1125(-)